jgi:hypothetical protein
MNLLLILLQSNSTNSADEFVKLDPYGIGMAVIAMLVVICVLAIAAIVFQNIDNLIHFITNFFAKKVVTQEKAVKTSTSGDEIAAIAMALHLYKSDLHDTESLTITFNRISRTYSPWSSKIYGIMNMTTKKNPYLK